MRSPTPGSTASPSGPIAFPEHRLPESWAAGDATARGVRLGLMAMKGEMGYPSA